jgi:hypothetical protein
MKVGAGPCWCVTVLQRTIWKTRFPGDFLMNPVPSVASRWLAVAALSGFACVPALAQSNREVNVICSVQAAWCNIIAVTF